MFFNCAMIYTCVNYKMLFLSLIIIKVVLNMYLFIDLKKFICWENTLIAYWIKVSWFGYHQFYNVHIVELNLKFKIAYFGKGREEDLRVLLMECWENANDGVKIINLH